jgi:hypothetical protein
VDGRHACHSDHVPDATRAREVQDTFTDKSSAAD